VQRRRVQVAEELGSDRRLELASEVAEADGRREREPVFDSADEQKL
jgi:hypothetical protein